MENFRFAITSIIILALIGFALYWAVMTIQSGTEHNTSREIKQLENENADLKKENKKLKDDLVALEQELENLKPKDLEKEQSINIQNNPPVITPEHKAIIDELKELVADNISLKLKSRGTRVGTIQKFLNIYNKTSNKVDNDYGATTQNSVKAFQKDQGLPADGEAGVSTFNKMISWLETQR